MSKITIIIQWFNDKQKERDAEYRFAVKKNLESPHVQSIVNLVEPGQELPQEFLDNPKMKNVTDFGNGRMTFADAFNYASQYLSNRYVLIMNLDNFIADTAKEWNNIDNFFELNSNIKPFVVLSRHEYINENLIEIDKWSMQGGCADGWLFKSPLILNEDYEFSVGRSPQAEQIIATNLAKDGYLVCNMGLKWKLYHYDVVKRNGDVHLGRWPEIWPADLPVPDGVDWKAMKLVKGGMGNFVRSCPYLDWEAYISKYSVQPPSRRHMSPAHPHKHLENPINEMVLVIQWYNDKCKERDAEYRFALQKNIDSSHIWQIVNLEEPGQKLPKEFIDNPKIWSVPTFCSGRMKFQDVFNIVNHWFVNEYILLMNLDNFIDDTAEWNNVDAVFKSSKNSKLFVALSRHDYISSNKPILIDRLAMQGRCADGWVFKAPMLASGDYDFSVGNGPYAEEIVASYLVKSGYLVANMGLKWRILHYDTVMRKGNISYPLRYTDTTDWKAHNLEKQGYNKNPVWPCPWIDWETYISKYSVQPPSHQVGYAHKHSENPMNEMVVIIQWYNDKNKKRDAEYKFAVKKNLESPHVQFVANLEEEGQLLPPELANHPKMKNVSGYCKTRMTFKDAVNCANNALPNEFLPINYVMIMNLDNYIDDTASEWNNVDKFFHLNSNVNLVVVISRHDYLGNGKVVCSPWSMQGRCADAWLFKRPLKLSGDYDFLIGRQCVELAVATSLVKDGYVVVNMGLKWRILHYDMVMRNGDIFATPSLANTFPSRARDLWEQGIIVDPVYPCPYVDWEKYLLKYSVQPSSCNENTVHIHFENDELVDLEPINVHSSVIKEENKESTSCPRVVG